MGESLVSSYLKNVEQCRIIQTNWKIFGNWSMGEQDKSRSKDYLIKTAVQDSSQS